MIPDLGQPSRNGEEVISRRVRITKDMVDLRWRVVLDYGCGDGVQTIELAREGCKIVACDINPHYIEALEKKNHTMIVSLVCGESSIPSFGDLFEIVVSYQVLEHVKDESKVLREMFRVLKPCGDLVISVPNKWWVFDVHGAYLLGPWNRVPFFSWLPKKIHDRYARARNYTRKEITDLLERHGFEVLESCYMKAPMDRFKPLKFLFRSDRTRFPFLATEIFIHARKYG